MQADNRTDSRAHASRTAEANKRTRQSKQRDMTAHDAASAATATDSKTYKQPVWQAAGLAGLLFEYFHIFLNIFEYFLISAL